MQKCFKAIQRQRYFTDIITNASETIENCILHSKTSNELEKRTREDESLFNLTMRAQTRALLTAQNVELMGQPMISFYSRTSRKKCVINNFRRQKMLLKRSKACFGDVSIGVEKQIQMMVVHQNILSNVMLKNYKLSNKNVRLQLATPETHRSSLVNII